MTNITLFQVLGWVLPSILVSLGIGIYLGRSLALLIVNRRDRRDRDRTMHVLQTLLESTDELTKEVGLHNSELQSVGQNVGHMKSGTDFGALQRMLLQQIAEVIQSNKRLENDLVSMRYQLEQQAQQLDRTQREARTDPLSGVGNRKGFDERIQAMMFNYQKKGREFALILADVDHFKWINDTHGHQAGDRVVTRIGQVLRECVRPHDYVARFGGDEFAILLHGTDLATAERVGQRIRSQTARTSFEGGQHGEHLSVTFSMGLASPSKGETVAELMERADRALYRSKQGGRNQLQKAVDADESVAQP